MEIPAPLLQLFQPTSRVAALTGAGVSAESGIPTFREAQTGLWATYDPTELATPRAFRKNPARVWEWYAYRRELIGKTTPNPAHQALAELEELLPRFELITQNIDNLHHRAGSKRVSELHGNIFRTRCFEENTVVTSWEQSEELPPRCPECGGHLRPDVVWFTEALPADALHRAFQIAENSDIFFSIGTSALVQPAASLPVVAKSNGAALVEINPEPTPVSSRADFTLRGPAGEVLPELVQRIQMKLNEQQS